MKAKRLTQRQRQEARGAGRIAPTKPQQRPLMPVNLFGSTLANPIVCGDRDDTMVPLLVETTGLVYGIRKGERRWVVGSNVEPAITVGGFVVVAGPPPEPEQRPTSLPDGTPGSAPELLGRIDQWPVAFTACVRCNERPAAPGDEWCDECLAEAAGETPLQRALRTAGT